MSPEFLQCQIEVGTRVCKTLGEARDELTMLRSTIADVAGNFGLAPIAASTHPFANWKDQHHTRHPREGGDPGRRTPKRAALDACLRRHDGFFLSPHPCERRDP